MADITYPMQKSTENVLKSVTITFSLLYGNSAKLSSEDSSRYSNTIESVVLRKCPYYHYLTKKVDARITNISQSLLHTMAKKTAGIECPMVQKLRHCHPIYTIGL